MLIVKLEKGDSLDKALKEMKMKVKRTKLLQRIREKEYYLKPSVKKRKMMEKAIRSQQILDSLDID